METLQGQTIFGELFGKEFQRNVAAELSVLSFINHTHPSPAQFAEDTVMRNCLPKHAGPLPVRTDRSWARMLGQQGVGGQSRCLFYRAIIKRVSARLISRKMTRVVLQELVHVPIVGGE